MFATDGNKHEYKTNPQKPGVARAVAFHDDKTVGTPSTTGTYRNGASPSNSNAPPGHKKDKSGEEQTHALRSMSGVLIKEWSAFVLKEVKVRCFPHSTFGLRDCAYSSFPKGRLFLLPVTGTVYP